MYHDLVLGINVNYKLRENEINCGNYLYMIEFYVYL